MPDNYDGAAHLKDLDADGVDAAIIYPGLGSASFTIDDRGFANALIRTYNNWLLDDFCGVDPRRLLGLTVIPVDDGMESTIAEFERLLAKGAKAFYLPGSPQRPYSDTYYDPLWKVATEAGTPLSFHRTHGGKPKGTGFQPNSTSPV
jgi:predicted TIM-barrel fold metal-dependent hydrolase